MTRVTLPLLPFVTFVAVLILGANPASGQDAPKRLSDWLLERPASPEAYPLGLSWQVPEEKVAQTALLLELLNGLSGTDREVTADAGSVGRLRDWIRTLPVTGRVTVSVPDARWMQANPAHDPILRSDHVVTLPKRPSSVTVITSKGERCSVTHSPGQEALTYLQACMPTAEGQIDWAWVAQPDGRIQHYGVASWNRQKQNEPAPGAWIWGPPRASGWPEKVSERLIAFLATQGPAPDLGEGAQLSGASVRSVPQLSGNVSRSRDAPVTANDWGGTGLLQTNTARMAKAGNFSFSFSSVRPYTQGNVFFQPFDWMEAGFRYTNVSNRLYGPADLSGSQTFKDKSIDVKLRLWKESAYVPEIALGLRDVAGTGLFSGEYLVASKRTGDLDWSLGMGWGYVGGRGNIRNPLGRVFAAFNTRDTTVVGQGGVPSFSTYFRGPASLFGGVQYQTPWEKLILKVEYDGNDYQHQPQANNLAQRSPFNIGLVYRAASAVDLTVGVERGNTVMFGVAFHTQLDGMQTPKPGDPPRVPVSVVRPNAAPDWAATSREIQRQSSWHVEKIEQRDRELRVTVDDVGEVYWRDRVDRAAAVLHRDAPAPVERFSFVYRQRGLDVAEHSIDRGAWVEKQTQPLAPQERREAVIARSPENVPPQKPVYESPRPRFEHSLDFDYRQTLGGPDAFVLFQISAVERVKLRLRNDTWIQGGVRLGLLDNYSKFKYDAPSNLPRVRTFLREYLTTSALTMPNLQATHVGKLSENQYYSVYGGYLEDMFGGVGGEWLYRPFASRVAVSANINAVRQRNFDQGFGFRDYKTVTGHGTVYWDTGWQDLQMNLSVGRYLAKDFGATLDVSRVFKNGVRVGAFATKTNVSSATFGEGSFDKGIYLSIPFDAMLTKSSNTVASFLWKPLTRDGGAMLARENTLYGLTSARSDRTLWYEPAPPPNDSVMPADRREEWTPKPTGPEPTLQVSPKPAATQWTPGSNYEYNLIEALYRQGFRNIKVAYDASQRLSLTLANDTIRPASRAVGRAARTAIRLAPLEAREIRITFAQRTNPVVTYDFIDLPRLDRYFGGTLPLGELAPTIAIEYLDPSAREKDPLSLLGDLDTAETPPKLAESIPGYRSMGRVGNDLAAAGRTAKDVNWVQAGLIGSGLVLASSMLDKRAFKFAQDHADSRWLKGFNTIGNALPYIGAGLVAVAALDGSDPRRSSTGFAALESAGAAFLVSTGLKYMTGRARPEAGLGSTSFKPFSSQDAFPSRHAILAWAVATPFALEYDSNWRYATAAVASLARVTKREHWMSDVVAGSLLGYGIGRIFWESSRAQNKGGPRAMLDPSGIRLAWDLD
jgi:membrane-associated phospholipid phosphatase